MRKRVKSKPSKRSSRAPTVAATYWKDQIEEFGRKTLYVDTGAILEYFNPENDRFSDFFDHELVGDRLVTSSYVVAETVRRLVKTKQSYKFVGPIGQQKSELAVHFLRGWLEEHNVSVLHIPEEVFDAARSEFEGRRAVGCDLTDVISYVIVIGLEQKRIVSTDRQHFQSLALTCLP